MKNGGLVFEGASSHVDDSAPPIILASRSPRRATLLKQVGLPFTTMPGSAVEPEILVENDIADQLERIAMMKVDSVLASCPQPSVIIGADTTVLIGDRILGKAENPEQARKCLRILSGRTHIVFTGLVVLVKGRKRHEKWTGCAVTKVRFMDLSPEWIEWYAETGEPTGKAGGYGIQGFGALFVAGIEGSYSNVMGLPLETMFGAFEKLRINPWR